MIYFLVGLIVLGITIALWDATKVILKIVAAIVVAFLVGRAYSLIDHPVWIIYMMVVALVIYNVISITKYCIKKKKATKILEEAVDASKEINNMEDEIREVIEDQVSAAITEMGMGTDAEIYDKASGYLTDLDFKINTLNERKKALEKRMPKVHIEGACYIPIYGVRAIEQAYVVLPDMKQLFIITLKKLVDSKKLLLSVYLTVMIKIKL